MATIAFLLITAGVMLTYGEFIWLGKLVFGVAGAVIMMAGLAMLWRVPHSVLGLWLIAASVACFVIEAIFKTYWIAGIAATVLWACGFWRICPQNGVPWPLAFSLSGPFGAATIWLFAIAKRARLNKRIDVHIY